MYIIQSKFKSEKLELKYSNMFVFNSKEEIVSFLKKDNLKYECEVYTKQLPHIREDMARHWARKGNSDVNTLIEFVRLNDYVLLFPVFKLCEVNNKGQLTKFKDAILVYDNVYYVNKCNDKGVFLEVTDVL